MARSSSAENSDVEMVDGTRGKKGGKTSKTAAKGKGKAKVKAKASSSESGSDSEDQERRRKRRNASSSGSESEPKGQQEGNEEAEVLDKYGGNTKFDMTQTMYEKREIKLELRKHALEIENSRKNILDLSVQDMTAQIERTDFLFRNVKTPSEAVLDSKMLMMQSDMGAMKARQLKIDANAFDTDDFLSKALLFLGGSKKLHWEKMGRLLLKASRRVPTIEFLHGPLEIQVKEKKVRTQRATQKIDESLRQRPMEIDPDAVKKDDQETAAMVMAIGKMLEEVCDEAAENNQSVAFLRFIMNPDSFPQTVENMFYFSFLVKECKASVELDEEETSDTFGDVIVFPCEAATSDQVHDGAIKHQSIFEVDHALWEAAIEAYGITSSMIPTRAPRDENDNRDWTVKKKAAGEEDEEEDELEEE